ncbi:ketohexokinase-like [Schistocerca gregaria]|uniref:ketohexokinase-like n=1 Tax=Schistocerca gregaria TaxID=7010 RepID=UPI00211E43F3|nr:ketohexokinase-like [Schistocerca gregaria]
MAMSDKRILCVGLICLDELLYCENYPVEDYVEMVVARELRPGGNAANDCAVLGELGIQCDLVGTLSINSRSGSFVKQQLESYGVNLKLCEIVEDKEFPVSICIINKSNGSRTILHHSGEWPWVSYEAFLKIDLSQYAWIHLEARNFDHLKKVAKRILAWNSGERRPIPMSIDMQDYDDQCLELIPTADLVIVSKDFARALGYKSMSDTLDGLYGYLKPGATLVVPWGDQGAAAKGPEGVFLAPAYPPERVLDTLAMPSAPHCCQRCLADAPCNTACTTPARLLAPMSECTASADFGKSSGNAVYGAKAR